jgi:hypothetical protein
MGLNAGNATITGANNVGWGYQVLKSLTFGTASTAAGYQSLLSLTTGVGNNAFGEITLTNLISGSNNIALGVNSGSSYTSSESSNILLNHIGVLGESNVLRISASGTGSRQVSKAFIGGIYNVVAAGTQQVALIGSGDQVGGSTTLPAGLTIPQPVIQGITSGAAPVSGQLGQIITFNVPLSSAVNLVAGTTTSVGSQLLPTGNWLVTGNIELNNTSSAGTSLNLQLNTSVEFGDESQRIFGGFSWAGAFGASLPPIVVSSTVASPATVFLVAEVGASAGTSSGCGNLVAIRIS